MRAAAILLAASVAAAAGACTERALPPKIAKSALADSAEQILYGVRNLMTDRGLMRAELHSDTAFVFDESTRTELRTVNLTFHGPTGTKDATLSSRAGTLWSRLNVMEARGNVVVITADGRRLASEHLKYDTTQDQVSSDSAFTLTEPGRRLEGIGFTSDPNMNNMRCLKACRGETGSITLPSNP